MIFRPVLVFLLVLQTACTTGPKFDNTLYSQRTTPEEAAKHIDTYRDSNVMWGGLLISTTILESSTKLELLSYPLNRKQRPDTTKSAQGRFILVVDGFLEPVDYEEGRTLTATGRLTDTMEGVVGEAQYLFPLVEAKDIFLWSKNSGSTQPRVHVGVGFIFDS